MNTSSDISYTASVREKWERLYMEKINSAMAKARPERNEIRRIRFSLRSVMDGCCLSKFKLLFFA